jgi:hypothetical protein
MIIELGLHDSPLELMDEIEFYTNLRSGLRLKEQVASDNTITLHFDCLEQIHQIRVLVDDLNTLAPLSKCFERTAIIKFRSWTEIVLPAWYYIHDLVIEKNPLESESLWQANFKVTVSLKDKSHV